MQNNKLTSEGKVEIIKQLTSKEIIKNLVVYPFLIYATTYDKISLLKANFPLFGVINSALSISAILFDNADNRLLEEEKNNHNYYPSSKFNQIINRIRSKLNYILIGVNIATLSVNTIYFVDNTYEKYKIVSTNPFNDKSINTEFTKKEIMELITYGIDKNQWLTDDEKVHLKKLETYFLENEYLDLEELYYKVATIEVRYEENEKKLENGIIAEYNGMRNLITTYNELKTNISLPHEYIHATGNLSYFFLNEGMTSILASEYCFDGQIVDGYNEEILLTEMLIEITSSKTMLESFTKKDDNILIEKLSSIGDVSDATTLLETIDDMIIDARKSDNKKIDPLKKQVAFKTLMKYLNSAILPDNTKINAICNFLTLGQFDALPKFNYNHEKINGGPNYIIDSNTYELSLSLLNLNNSYNSEKTR